MKLLQKYKQNRELKKLAPDYYKYFKQNKIQEQALYRLSLGWTPHDVVMLEPYTVDQVNKYGRRLVYFLTVYFKWTPDHLYLLNSNRRLEQTINKRQKEFSMPIWSSKHIKDTLKKL